MIITFLIILMTQLLAIAWAILPSGSLSPFVISSISTVMSWVWIVDVVLDVQVLLTLFLLFMTIEVAILGASAILWAYSKIPIIGK